jgi:hypothetical protein
VDGNLGPASRRRGIYVIRKPELRITDGTAFQENVLMDVNTKMQLFIEFWLTKKVCLAPLFQILTLKNQALEEK